MAELKHQGHLSGEQLLWLYYGEETPADVELHLSLCRECGAEYEALKAALASIDTYSAPLPAAGYEDRLWLALVKRDASLGARPAWWRRWMLSPWRLGWAAGLVALLLAAFLAGRFSHRPAPAPDLATAPAVVRERLLVAALSEHLEQSERILLEIENQNLDGGRQRAENLLAANRLYRQTAAMEGKAALTATLEDLERVLLDVAHAPDNLPAGQLRQLRARVDDQGLLFRVKVLGLRLRELDRQPLPRPSQTSKSMKG